jgi:hypothetical protein
MDNRASFHREKISRKPVTREKLHGNRADYGEKDTGAGKLPETYVAHRRKKAKSGKFRREFQHRHKQLINVCAIGIQIIISDIFF